MTNILDLTREYNERNKKKGGISLAEQEFLSNISSIKAIKNTPGYILIKNYWEKELLRCIGDIREADANNISLISKLQAKLDLAQRFTGYLTSYDSRD